jgi:hypothetical protein
MPILHAESLIISPVVALAKMAPYDGYKGLTINQITQELEIEKLERQFPPASGVVFAAARLQVLASWQSVLQSEDGSIFEVFPDGHRHLVKIVEPPISVTIGSKVKLL